jgi:hypothetical protein
MISNNSRDLHSVRTFCLFRLEVQKENQYKEFCTLDVLPDEIRTRIS